MLVSLLSALATCQRARVPGAPGAPPTVARAFPCSAFSLLLLPCSTAHLPLQLLPPANLSGQVQDGRTESDNDEHEKLTWVPELQDAEHSAHSAQPDQTQPVELEEVAQVTFTCNKIIIMLRRVSWSKVSAGRRKTYDVDAHPSLPGTLPWLNSVQVATMPVASTGDFPTLHYTHLQQSMHGHRLSNTPGS